jgi:hypothetical protein
MALAAAGTMAVLDVGSSPLAAAPSASPFAGTFGADDWPVPITISNGGRIASSFLFNYYDGLENGKATISGRVDADGSYSYTRTVIGTFVDPERGTRNRGKSSDAFAGTMTLDADRDIVGTTDTGGAFVWLRQ